MTDYPQRLQRLIDHIEAHLDADLNLPCLAALAHFSPFHCHRVFLNASGETVMDYVRKRRLARAARSVVESDEDLIGIALAHGFRSPETFLRAFRRQYGLTPSAFRRRGLPAPDYPPLALGKTTALGYLGGLTLKPRIEIVPAFRVIGFALQTTCRDGRNFREIPAFWDSFIACGAGRVIPNPLPEDQSKDVILGICMDNDPVSGNFSYLIGRRVSSFENALPGMVCRTIPEARYAIFTTPEVPAEEYPNPVIQQTWQAIYGEWFPNSSYENAGTAEIEWYDARSEPGVAKPVMDIYIPIRERA